VPRGRYLLQPPDGPRLLERFSCGPGPAGWRYAATRTDADTGAPRGRLDLVLDARGRVLRHEAEAGGWLLRGGAVGDRLLWRRGDDEHEEVAAGFSGTSPAYAVAAVRLLRPVEPVRARFVQLDDAVLAPLVVEQGWSRTGTLDVGGREVARYEVADLGTGERRVVQLAGDLVLEATGVVLAELEG